MHSNWSNSAHDCDLGVDYGWYLSDWSKSENFKQRVMSGVTESQSDLPTVLELLKEVPALPEIAIHSMTRISSAWRASTRHPRVVGSNPTPC